MTHIIHKHFRLVRFVVCVSPFADCALLIKLTYARTHLRTHTHTYIRTHTQSQTVSTLLRKLFKFNHKNCRGITLNHLLK